jgi:hypothetical protein
MVETYSEKELTLPKDKLPAMSWIGRQFGDATKDRYLARLCGLNCLDH